MAVAVSLLALTSLACTLALFEAPGGSAIAPLAGGASAGEAGATPTPIPEELLDAAYAEEQLLINLYQRVSPSVVNVDVSASTNAGDLAEFGQGSGFVYDTEGHIITNYHVVVNADDVRVVFNDGRAFPAEVVGMDEFADLAVIKITPPADYPLTPLELGDSDSLQVGQRVIAIGNPFGLSGTMTVGIISAVGRTLPSAVITDTGVFSNPLIIQTDAAINPGNSGGPLLDSHGRVIGVNAAIRSQSGVNSGIGFAIPVNTVARVVPQIIETGEVRYPYLGISAQTDFSMAELAAEFDLPVSEGVLVATVSPGSGAARAGLRGGNRTEILRGREVQLGGDIITAIDGVPIRNFDELLGYLVSNTSVGQTITVSIVRGEQTLDLPVTLGARPRSSN